MPLCYLYHQKIFSKGVLILKHIIRKADKRHLNDINRLITEAKIGTPINKLYGNFWFIRIDKKIVACVGVEIIGNNSAILTYLAVTKECRKQGIGMTLHNHVVQFCKERGIKTIAFITMYYHFNRFKKRGFKTCPRKELPDQIKNYWMFTEKRYMKCAAMIQKEKPLW
jgi:N-acetylglutamate synthase-like GNAT family acetyltransferase